MKEKIKEELVSLLTGRVLFNEPLKNHTSFKIGGMAEALIIPQNKEDLRRLITYLSELELPYWIIGNGTNLLVSDQGLKGVVIKLSKLNKIEINKPTVKAQAGVKLPLLAKKVAKKGLSGLEFGVGLPATVGGAVVMNAGVKEEEIGKLITKVETLSSTGKLKTYSNLDFKYRKSIFQDKDEIVLGVELELNPKKPQLIKSRMKEHLAKRKAKQPLSLPNAGCVFKNPPSDSAGRLIDEAGCKGLTVGGAQVSDKHANFIVNIGEATAEDVLSLMGQVEKSVYKKFGVKLNRELEILF
ncbi:UDP-N-acetylenolpyruvoylglucosamine reductase [Halobacteroides halobius DSM 5150]|uniref:UDP-N-acetylenolpyruvoylglucosamine reductase n=1 Tax=Halobacteroides halobius (strain ATCC 35273 / DSM 5150 / MD-1) TaxID=748449 RepID=L0KC98_HALHC|nr:UDP-N-acetylmuramate dehydrogenase [Halobacteroides halobius]AGB41703.1 UDP-N-acetylenolpyruvoylglucosamine reductase [Halobacteroides halobius DSM 5150]